MIEASPVAQKYDLKKSSRDYLEVFYPLTRKVTDLREAQQRLNVAKNSRGKDIATGLFKTATMVAALAAGVMLISKTGGLLLAGSLIGFCCVAPVLMAMAYYPYTREFGRGRSSSLALIFPFLPLYQSMTRISHLTKAISASETQLTQSISSSLHTPFIQSAGIGYEAFKAELEECVAQNEKIYNQLQEQVQNITVSLRKPLNEERDRISKMCLAISRYRGSVLGYEDFSRSSASWGGRVEEVDEDVDSMMNDSGEMQLSRAAPAHATLVEQLEEYIKLSREAYAIRAERDSSGASKDLEKIVREKDQALTSLEKNESDLESLKALRGMWVELNENIEALGESSPIFTAWQRLHSENRP